MEEKKLNQKGQELINDIAKTTVEISEIMAEIDAVLKK